MSKGKLRLFKWIFCTIAYVALFTPLLVVIIANFDKYFVQKSGLSVTLGGVLSCFYILLLIKVGFKNLSAVFWAGGLWVITYCLESILTDSLRIVTAFLIGVIFFKIFDLPKNYFSRRLEAYEDEEIRTHARNNINNNINNGNGGRI